MEYETSYVPPVVLSDMDDEQIHQRMLSVLPIDIDATAGGFASDFTKPAALEKASMIMTINDVIQMFFPAWSFGTWLDQIALQMGIRRRPAGPAYGYVTITGDEGKLIPAGYLFATPSADGESNIEYEVMEDEVIGSDLTAVAYVRCTQEGLIGNVPAGSITLMVEPMTGIESLINNEHMMGGTEEESDDSLRERISERDLNIDVSFVGNPSDYKRWALEVTGVGSVVVIPEWKGHGTGTVKLIVLDGNGEPANPTILEEVYNHIMSPDDDNNRLAPVDAVLTVDTAVLLTVDISANVELDDGATIQSVSTSLAEAFNAYTEEAYGEGLIRITRVGSLLSKTPGVVDYTGLQINGGTVNIPVVQDDYPSVGTITLVVG